MRLEEQILRRFVEKKWTLSLAESCTGGGIAASLVKIPDCSQFFLGSIVAYSNDAKKKLLGVSDETLKTFGAVSTECALEMALGAKKAFGSTFSLAVTGIAGPKGGTTQKPVGTVCFALVSDEQEVWSNSFMGSREEIIQSSIQNALSKILLP